MYSAFNILLMFYYYFVQFIFIGMGDFLTNYKYFGYCYNGITLALISIYRYKHNIPF